MFKPWQLALIDEAGYNGMRGTHSARSRITACHGIVRNRPRYI